MYQTCCFVKSDFIAQIEIHQGERPEVYRQFRSTDPLIKRTHLVTGRHKGGGYMSYVCDALELSAGYDKVLCVGVLGKMAPVYLEHDEGPVRKLRDTN